MTFFGLKNVIRSLLKEEVDTQNQIEKFKKWTKKFGSEDEKLLLKNGIIPIPSSNKRSSFLGAGAYSTVYEVLWNERHAVAKVTKSKKDVKNILSAILFYFIFVYTY